MFDETKVTQAAAHLLERAGGTMNYMVLIKFLYAADRDSLFQRGRPITWDNFVAMKYGPVLSRIHDLITEMPNPIEPQVWKSFIGEPCNYKVSLISSPGTDELSQNEMSILDGVFDRYQRFLNRPFDLVDLLHREFPEVVEVAKGEQIPLTVDDVLSKNNFPKEQRIAILEEMNALQTDWRLLAR